MNKMISFLVEGVVVDNSDPQEMGRVKAYCPAIDGDKNNVSVKTLPWATYVSPLAGQAHSYPAGGSSGVAEGPMSYGFWAVPKLGAQVLIGFLYGDYNQRVYLGSFFRTHGNRSLPAGRNSAGAPTTDTFDPIEPATSNLKAQFGDLTSSIARTRGAYERQVAQAIDQKTDSEGYSTRVISTDDPDVGDLDPQTYCITTPGRHAIIMQDDPRFARLRLKTAEGHQVIFDDANERIYVSTAGGKTWLELDADGHAHLFAAESISMAAGKDFNISALGNVNIAAGGNVNIGASGHARISACADVSLSGDGGANITSGSALNLLAAAAFIASGSEVHFNGPEAAAASCADAPSIVPSHEPWTRPSTSGTRGPNWKE